MGSSLKTLVYWLKEWGRKGDQDRLDQADPRFVRKTGPTVRRILEAYFRMETTGMKRLPEGPALIVANHEGGVMWLQALVMGIQIMERFPKESVHGLAHDVMYWIPALRNFMVACGGIRADPELTHQLLKLGGKVIVAPGGDLEAFRTYEERYLITLGGRRGFVRSALRAGVPICPVVFVGGHETFFVLTTGRKINAALNLRRFIRTDVAPIYLGLPWGIGLGAMPQFPLPSKSTIEYLTPISLDQYKPEDADVPEIVDAIFRQVLTAMQNAMTRTAATRRWPVLG